MVYRLQIFDGLLKECQAQYNKHPSNDTLRIMTALNDAHKTYIEHTLTCLRSELSHSASEHEIPSFQSAKWYFLNMMIYIIK